MIRVLSLVAEPEALRDARQWRAARVIRQRRADPDASLDGQKVGYNIEGWRDAMLRAQHQKCAICERADIPTTSPIEHIRPWKHYPWLCWSASNHIVLCSDCNLSKLEQFPVSGARLPLGAWDTSSERPELVDPTRECPSAHVEYVLDAERGGEPAWVARGRTRRGATTVNEVYKLVKHHLDAWRRHVQRLEDLATELEARRPEELSNEWAKLVRRHVISPVAPYRALSLAWLQARFDAPWREARGLTLPSLADLSPAAPDQPLFTPEAALDALPEELALCVREGRGAHDDAARREAARGLHALGWGKADIAALLRVSVLTVQSYLR
ncbi:HNH endonuclease [Myxococcota bacterium]|nr:HNH endonuclease [Myxococcota bacterium]